MTVAFRASTTSYEAAAATPALLDALHALEQGDPRAARLSVHDAAEMVGISALCDRLAVAGRALAHDAGLLEADDRTLVRLLPEMAMWSHQVDSAAIDQIPRLLGEWRAPDDPRDAYGAASRELALSMLVLIGFLCSRLGYPPEVMA